MSKMEGNGIPPQALTDLKKTIQKMVKKVAMQQVFKNLEDELDKAFYEKGFTQSQAFLFLTDRFCTYFEDVLLGCYRGEKHEKPLKSFINEILTTLKKIKGEQG